MDIFRIAVLCSILAVFSSLPSHAATTITSTDVTVTPPDNCGFVVSAGSDGWIRMHLYNDSGSTRDIWVVAGRYYPLRVKDVLLPSGLSPGGLVVDDSKVCGYTRSFGADECGNYAHGDIPANVGFFAGEISAGYPHGIEVLLRTDSPFDPWRFVEPAAGEFILGDVATCNLPSVTSLTYITTVGQ